MPYDKIITADEKKINPAIQIELTELNGTLT
jgi:hypothetical protein